MEHAAVKALELIGLPSTRDLKRIMAQIDNYCYPAIGKAAFPGG